jgi:hypothetical protein
VTEQEWLACTDPVPMLEFLRGKSSDRKLRLFACACSRRVCHLFENERSQIAIRWRKVIAISETFADGLVDIDELINAQDMAMDCGREAIEQVYAATTPLELSLALLLQEITSTQGSDALSCGQKIEIELPLNLAAAARAIGHEWEIDVLQNEQVQIINGRAAVQAAEESAQASLLRHFVGNPFRPVSLDSSWLMPTVVSFAKEIYDNRAFDGLPILGDALEEAGCTNSEVLDHCRGPGSHVRGCWALDLMLGKE